MYVLEVLLHGVNDGVLVSEILTTCVPFLRQKKERDRRELYLRKIALHVGFRS